MTNSSLERVLWGGALLVTLIGAFVSHSHEGLPTRPANPIGVPPAIPTADLSRMAAAVEGTVARDPFRAARRPSPVAFAMAVEGLQPPPPKPPKPSLVLVGIVGGVMRTALVDGFPGREGSVLVQQGDTVAGLRIRTITRDTVIIAGMDTTWRLGVRRAW